MIPYAMMICSALLIQWQFKGGEAQTADAHTFNTEIPKISPRLSRVYDRALLLFKKKSRCCVKITNKMNHYYVIQTINATTFFSRDNRVIFQESLHWIVLKVIKTSFGKPPPPLKKNEMEALITNHVKENVLANAWWYKFCRDTAF